METVMKKNSRGESALKKEQRLKAAGVPESSIVIIYEYWLEVLRPGRTRVPTLDAKRRLKVASAIADYGIEDCKRAIDGCAASDFHMGRNKANKRYDDLELIFRDQDHVERFLGYTNQELQGDW
ncbi:uncharacterized protein METZ01_LOCUS295235 [marine metagenome]|uniref:Uncharacterized protein n=1 Tax=marine metagenome TaxID=408172 RepID=A0A382M5A0_9ZZZZ